VPSSSFLVKNSGKVPSGTSENIALIGDYIHKTYAATEVIVKITA
jgi:hypothetical protein